MREIHSTQWLRGRHYYVARKESKDVVQTFLHDKILRLPALQIRLDS